jgi:hypothetical protein
MRIIFHSVILLFFLSSCSNPKTVLICGDHICVNKTEAKQFFEENLSIEVKIIDNKKEPIIDLIELNLRENKKGKKEVNAYSKKTTSRSIKTLSNAEVIEIKKNIKKKKINKNVSKKIVKPKNKEKIFKRNVSNNELKSGIKTSYNNMNKKKTDIANICTILEKCSIDEISKYLLKIGKEKDFPDVTIRE